MSKITIEGTHRLSGEIKISGAKNSAVALIPTALLAKFGRVEMSFPGGCNIGARPIDIHIKGFEQLGAKVEIIKNRYIITADKLVGKRIYFDFPSVGATINVMLAAVGAEGTTIIDNAAMEPEIVNVASFLINMGVNVSPVEIAKKAYAEAKSKFYDVLIIDTAGRLEIDEPLMVELNQIEQAVSPNEVLLLVDAMSGQNAVNVANAFNERLKLTGLVMSKLDGDARGGSALSIKHLTGLPIKFAGVGEKIEDLEIFYPERMADRILGMGDIITLAEKAQENIDEKATKKAMNKMMDGTFDLDDMLAQMKQIQKLGSLGGLLRMIPGMPKISKEQTEMASKEMRLMETVINSMTFEERHKPDILKAQRKIRIAKGSGTQVSDINRMLKKFEQMREMMKQSKNMMKGGKLPPNFNSFPH